MNQSEVTCEIKETAAYITIHRPEVLNALSLKVAEEIADAVRQCDKREDVQCIVISGEGEKAFAAGADIEELKNKKSQEMMEPGGMQEIFTAIYQCRKPTIAKVKGYALGGGFELALACDIRIAAENAKFGFPELNLAILPGAGGTQRLTKVAGEGRALYLCLTGEIVNAQTALEWGIVSELHPLESIEDRVKKLTEKISSKGPLAAELTKLAVKQGEGAQGLLIEKMAQAVLFETKDKQEGIEAFLEKRKAVFQGH
ncbi:enoyl-CoA hydratase/isomerase family protein [Alkalicoccus daliensis]|uniref:Enoyl-CoA hydratase n=1 Tax=Alkalicoccus daliensis TaxID=745820 RepID=A0A1H0J070_9BACI|nr:enoyl-CoA hydratase/isomerase family protein [Alkalicoccus daliensis]SDO37106.1 enoyl-CoA hydratase [Alkalicoccus daliensis]